MKAIRFRPPEVEPTPELRWVMHRAFARNDISVPPPRDPAMAFDLARRLHLAPRIAARAACGVLSTEVGPSADDFSRAYHLAVGNGLRYQATLQHIAKHADDGNIPLIVLKGGALALLGISAPGARSFSDLDVLVPLDRMAELRSALVAAGWLLSPLAGSEHQEPPLTHPALGMIELHRCIPGVRPPGSRRSFNARTLTEAGLTEALPAFSDSIRVPARSVLTAHALVHGLVQHGYDPDGYPLLRLIADLQDLRADPALLPEASGFLSDFDSEDLEAIWELFRSFESGTAFSLPDGPARSLLDHFVAGHLDSDYALGLKAHFQALRAPSDLPDLLGRLRWAYMVTFLSHAQVDELYGPPKAWWGYVARQLLRPFDLAFRMARSVAALRHTAGKLPRRLRSGAFVRTQQIPRSPVDHGTEK